MGLEHLNHSVDPEIAEKDGQPVAHKTIRVGGVTITFKVVTKPVTMFGGRYPSTYFWSDLKINGQWLNPNTIWSDEPTKAMEASLQWWLDQIRAKMPYANDLFPDRIKAVDVNGRRGWRIEGTHGRETDHTCDICQDA